MHDEYCQETVTVLVPFFMGVWSGNEDTELMVMYLWRDSCLLSWPYRVKYILNVTREIDNFYPEEFKYLNIRYVDVPLLTLPTHSYNTYIILRTL